MAVGLCYRCMEEYQGQARECPYCHAPASYLPLEPDDLAPGERVGPAGRYLVGWRVGREDDCVVYRARDVLASERKLVYELYPAALCRRAEGAREMTLLPDADPAEYSRRLSALQAQAQRLQRLNGVQGVQGVTDFFAENGTAYLVADDAPGDSLRDILASRGGQLREKEAVEIAVSLLRALESVHQARLLHRAVRPEHFVRDLKGRWTLTGLIGEACALPVLTPPPPSRNGAYRAPEQLAGGAEGPCTDVYAAALCLYEMLEGRLPGDTADAPSAAPETRACLARALSPRPEERYPSAAAFADALEGRKPAPPAPPKPEKKNRRWPWLLAAALLIPLLAGYLLWALPAQRVSKARREAWDALASALPASVSLLDGEAEELPLPIDGAAFEGYGFTAVCDVADAYPAGRALRLLPRKPGAGALTLSDGDTALRVPVTVQPTLTGLSRDRVSLYAGGGVDVALDYSEGLALSVDISDPALLSAEVVPGALRITSLSGAGAADITVSGAGKAFTLRATVLPSPYASYLAGIPSAASVYEGEETYVDFNFDGVSSPVLAIEYQGGAQYAEVTQEAARLRVRGLAAGTAECRVFDGQGGFSLTITVRPSLKGVQPSEIALFSDEEARVALIPYASALPEPTVTIGDESVLFYEHERGSDELALKVLQPGECVVTVGDGLHAYPVHVVVSPAPRAADLTVLPEEIALRMGETAHYSLARTRGDALPALVTTLVSGADVAQPDQRGGEFILTARAVGEGVYDIADEVSSRRVRVTVKPSLQSLGTDSVVELIAGQSAIVPITAAGGELSGISWEIDPQGLVSCERCDEGLLIKAGKAVGSCVISVTDGQNRIAFTARVRNRLEGVKLPEGNGRRPTELSEAQLSAYSDWLCVDAADNLTLTLALTTATGDFQEMEEPWLSDPEAACALDERDGQLVISALKAGGTALRLTLGDETYLLWIEVANRLRGDPTVPEALYGDDPALIEIPAYFGLTGLTVTDSERILTLSQDERGNLQLTASALGVTTLLIDDGARRFERQVEVRPRLKGVLPMELSFTAGVPCQAELTLYFAFDDPGSPGLSFKDSNNFFASAVLSGSTLTIRAELVTAGGVLTITDEAARARGEAYQVRYGAVLTPAPATATPTPSPTPTPTPTPTPIPTDTPAPDATPTPAPTATPTPAPTPTPKPTQAPARLNAAREAVIAGDRLYVLDDASGRVLAYARSGEQWSLADATGGRTAFEHVSQRGGVPYALDNAGVLHLWRGAERFTSDFDELNGTQQLLTMQFEAVADAAVSDSAILVLVGGDDPEYSAYDVDKRATVAYGAGNCAYWLAGSEENECRPVARKSGKLKSDLLLKDVAAIGLNGTAAAAVQSDGTLWAWGDLGSTLASALGVKNGQSVAQTVKVTENRQAVPLGGSVSVGAETLAAVARDGRVAVAGANDRGQQGQGDLETQKGFRMVSLPDGAAARAYAGDGFTLALSVNGTLYGWGDNREGQLGLPLRDLITAPAPIYENVGSFTLSEGDRQALATEDGALIGWSAGSVPSPMNLVD